MATKKQNFHRDYQKNEIQNAVDQNLASAPASPKEGQFYWDTTTKEDMIYNGSAWVSRTTQGKTYTAGTGIDITGTVVSNTGVRSIATGTTNGKIKVNTGGTEAEVSVYGLGSAAYLDTTTSVTSSETKPLTSGGAYTNLVRRLSTSAATGSASQGVYVDANGQVQTCNAVTSTYSSTGTDPVNGTAVASAIASAISSVYKPAGSVAFANKPALSSSIEGNVYNITDSFTTTSDFVEGAGNTYPAGTNIVCINTTGTTYKWDVLAGFVDLSGYQLANTAVTHTASTAVGSATQPVYIASDGTATETTYSLSKSVPADAVFTDTTYSVFTGATASSDGTTGLVPAPTSANYQKFLRGDGTWSVALTNSSGGTGSLHLLSSGASVNSNYATAIGYWGNAYKSAVSVGWTATADEESVAIGGGTDAGGTTKYATSAKKGIAIGFNAKVNQQGAIAIGYDASATVANTFVVALNSVNYTLLDASGIIPNARISMDTEPTSASTNAITSGAVYTAITGMAKKIVATNTALTASSGVCTWTISNTLGTDECGVFIKEVSTNEYVDMYYEVTSSTITIKINSASNIAAGTYKAIIIG